jgi:hypothetical protein
MLVISFSTLDFPSEPIFMKDIGLPPADKDKKRRDVETASFSLL